MFIFCTAITAVPWRTLGMIYLIYGIASNFLYMAWTARIVGITIPGPARRVSTSCPGAASRRTGQIFGMAFRQRSWALYPGWFLSPLVALYLLVTTFTWWMLALLAVFCIVSFGLLPEISRKHCEGCETEDYPRRPKPIKVW